MKNKESVKPSPEEIRDKFYKDHVQLIGKCQYQLFHLLTARDYDQAAKVTSMYVSLLSSVSIFLEVPDDD